MPEKLFQPALKQFLIRILVQQKGGPMPRYMMECVDPTLIQPKSGEEKK